MPEFRFFPVLSLSLLTVLSACGGDGRSQPGINARVQTTYLSSSTEGDVDAVTDPQNEESAQKNFRTDDDTYVELRTGLVNLKAVALTPCASTAAAAASRLLDFVFPPAMAHSAIPAGPSGVIDVLKPDLLVWNLGQLGATPGSYCGLMLEIAVYEDGGHDVHAHSAVGVAAETGGQEEHFSMVGKGIVINPCVYEDGPDSEHGCFQAAYTGEALQRKMEFAGPLKLNSTHRAANVLLATEYDTWLDSLDLATLETSAAEQAALAQNVINSFYVMTVE